MNNMIEIESLAREIYDNGGGMNSRVIAESAVNTILTPKFPINHVDEILGWKSSNTSPMRRLDETHPGRIINKYGGEEGFGYIVISASRQDLLPSKEVGRLKKMDKMNYERNNQLLQIIRSGKWSHTPCYGRTYEFDENGQKVPVEERGFIIYNRKYIIGETEFEKEFQPLHSLEELRNFGERLCKTFEQDCFLYVAPKEMPKWISGKGKIEREFNQAANVNDMVARYFTSLIKPNKNMTADSRKTRITYDMVECLVNPWTATRSEQMQRYYNHEVF